MIIRNASKTALLIRKNSAGQRRLVAHRRRNSNYRIRD